MSSQLPVPLSSRLVAFTCCMVAALCAAAAEPGEADRAQLQREIKRTTAAFAAEEAACHERFAVTACVEDTRIRKRETLAPLRLRLLALDDADRKRRAAERVQAVERKQEQLAQRPPPQEAPAKPPRTAASSAASASSAVRATKSPELKQQAASDAAAQRAAASERRRVEIQQDALRIQQRLADKERRGNASAPLPPPPDKAGSAAH